MPNIDYADDDVLVGGSTSYDGDVSSLQMVQAEWTSNHSYADRVANISGTGTGPRFNGNVFIQPDVTAFDDAAVDTLTGTSGQDVFIVNNDSGVLDVITDLKKTETSLDVDVVVT